MKYLTNVVTLELMAELCTGCGRCLEVCPREVFGKNGKNVRIMDRDLGIECGACMDARGLTDAELWKAPGAGPWRNWRN